jgi:hypothetical protein
MKRWNEHVKAEESAQLFAFYENESYGYIDEEIEESKLHEIQEIIRNLKKTKTPGTNNITVEILQAAGPQMTQGIQKLIINIWRYERMPNEWNKSLICPIYNIIKERNLNVSIIQESHFLILRIRS